MTKHYTSRAQAQRTAFNEVELRFPFHAELVELLKSQIPYRSREYVPSTKTWRIGDGFQDLALDLLLRHFPDADVPHRARPHAAPKAKPPGSDHYAVLHLQPTAPPELISVVYRALAKLHHPDKGGDPAAMRRLTEAHDALSRRLSA